MRKFLALFALTLVAACGDNCANFTSAALLSAVSLVGSEGMNHGSSKSDSSRR